MVFFWLGKALALAWASHVVNTKHLGAHCKVNSDCDAGLECKEIPWTELGFVRSKQCQDTPLHPYRRCPKGFTYEDNAATFDKASLYYKIETCIGKDSRQAFEDCLTEEKVLLNELDHLGGSDQNPKYKIHYYGARQDIKQIRRGETPDVTGTDFQSRDGVFSVLTIRPKGAKQDQGFILYRGSSPRAIGAGWGLGNILLDVVSPAMTTKLFNYLKGKHKNKAEGDWAHNLLSSPAVAGAVGFKWQARQKAGEDVGAWATLEDKARLADMPIHEGFGSLAQDQFELVMNPRYLEKQNMEGHANICEFVRAVRGTGEPVRLIGYSLGGALAQLNAVLMSTCLSPAERDPVRYGFSPIQVWTFGSPKVGGSEYDELRRHFNINHTRMLNAQDPVPQVPRSFAEEVKVGQDESRKFSPFYKRRHTTWAHSADVSVEFDRVYDVEENVQGCYICVPSQPKPRHASEDSVLGVAKKLPQAKGHHLPGPYQNAIDGIREQIAKKLPPEQSCAPGNIPIGRDEWNRDS